MAAQPQDVDLRVVRYAVTLAGELHFGRAAAKLSITQQTLSTQIARLERQLGVALFLRNRRHVELTDIGRIFVDRGKGLLADAQDLLAVLGQGSPPLRLDVLAEGGAPDLLARRLRLRLPDIDLETVHGNGLAVTAARLNEGQVDLAFGRVHWPHTVLPATLSHELVRLTTMGVALPSDHPLAERSEIPLAELAEHPLLLYTAPESLEWQDWNDQLVAEFGLKVVRRLRGHGSGAANAAVLAYGMPRLAALETPLLEGMTVRPLVEPVPVYPWSMVWRPDRMNDSLASALTTIRAIVAELRWLEPPAGSWWLPAVDRSAAPKR